MTTLAEINVQIIEACQPTVDFVDPISQITEQLYLGQGRATAFAEHLIQLGITHIVSIGLIPHDSVRNHTAFQLLELPDIVDTDRENIVIHFPIIFSFIRNALSATPKGKIYLHCAMGISRSATVMIAFLRANGICDSLQSSYDLVKRKRPWIAPNQGFQDQLREFFCERGEP